MSVVDCFTAWLNIYHFSPNQVTSNSLISTLRALFIAYGIPEEISTDGGPQFTSTAVKTFLSKWGEGGRVKHSSSSAEYTQSNGRAELAVKTVKHIIIDNIISSDGSLDNDSAAAAIMQYGNSPLPHLNLNPAQLMLHRTLCDQLPTNLKYYELHQEWIISADEHEKALAKRNEEILTRYNKTAKTLPELSIGTQVLIHQPKKRSTPQWIKTAEIISKLPNRQYKVKCHATGRVTLRNRRFNKPLPTPHQSTTPHPVISPKILPQSNENQSTPNHHPAETDAPPASQSVPNINTPVVTMTDPANIQPSNTIGLLSPAPSKTPLALKCLRSFNKPGIKE